jgi:uncharacterized protein YjdB
MSRFRLGLPTLAVVLLATAACSTTPVESPALTVSVSLGTPELMVGETVTAVAVVHDQSGNVIEGQPISWSSSDQAIATVGSGAQVSALAEGSAEIVATSGSTSGRTTLRVRPRPVATVTVALASSNLTVGQTTQATATTRSANNSVLTGRTIAWTSDNAAVATVSSTGVVTSVAAGTAQITATSEGKSGSATVTVSAVAAIPVASVSVSLASPSLVAGQTTQATATTRDANNAVLTGRAITWSSDNTAVATVSGTGLVTSVADGTAHIIATSEGKSGNATVTVTPPATSAAECVAAKPEWIWCDDFETNRLASYFEYVDAAGGFVRAASVGRDGSSGMRIHFNAGQVSVGALHLAFGRTPDSYFKPVDAGTANYREIYWRMYLRNQPGWVGGGGDKLSRAMVFANSNWAQAMIAPIWSGIGAQQNQLGVDPERLTDEQGNLLSTGYNDGAHITYLGNASGPLTLFDAAHVGQWHCIEAHVRLNDAGSANGIMELWINGALQVRQTTLNWLGSYAQYGINSLFFENYWNAGSPAAQDRYFDNIVVSTQRIGCLP